MTLKRNEKHLAKVEAWEKKNADGLPVEKQVELFEKAFYAIEQRTLKTLSSVTLQVVLDRVLHQSASKFPFLSLVKLRSNGFNFKDLVRNEENHDLSQVVKALRYMLAELILVIGKITAEILTAPLYKELDEVTIDFQKPETEEDQTVRQINSSRKSTEKS